MAHWKAFLLAVGGILIGFLISLAFESKDRGTIDVNPLNWQPISQTLMASAICVSIVILGIAFVPWQKFWQRFIRINPIFWSWPVWFELLFSSRRVNLIYHGYKKEFAQDLLAITLQVNGSPGVYGLSDFRIRDGWCWREAKAEDRNKLIENNRPTDLGFRIYSFKSKKKVKTRVRALFGDRYVYSNKFELDLTDPLSGVFGR